MLLPPRRDALKQATASAHAALDEMVGGFATVADYRRYLQGIAAFRLPVEAWLSTKALPQVFSDWQPGLVHEELKADLSDLDTPEPVVDRPFSPPEGEGVVGLLYGAGRLIARRPTSREAGRGAWFLCRLRRATSFFSGTELFELACVFGAYGERAWIRRPRSRALGKHRFRLCP
ncbi:MAG: biliverdin-producing heme oxygenase [Allorhizobium sp.]